MKKQRKSRGVLDLSVDEAAALGKTLEGLGFDFPPKEVQAAKKLFHHLMEVYVQSFEGPDDEQLWARLAQKAIQVMRELEEAGLMHRLAPVLMEAAFIFGDEQREGQKR